MAAESGLWFDLCNELSKEHDVTLMVLHSLDKVDFYLKEVSNNVRVVSMNKRMGLDIGCYLEYIDISVEKSLMWCTRICVLLLYCFRNHAKEWRYVLSYSDFRC